MDEIKKPPILQVPKLKPDVAVDEDPATLGIYLEVPTHSRRRRSFQCSISSETNSEVSVSGMLQMIFSFHQLVTPDILRLLR